MGKIKILWVCNIILPELSDLFAIKRKQIGGWLSGMWNELKKRDNFELAMCTPVLDVGRMKDGEYEGYKFYSFHFTSGDSEIPGQIERFQQILRQFKPDVIHIWGTEYVHSYAMMVACVQCGCQHKVVANIQGLASICAEHYLFGLPAYSLNPKYGGVSLMDEKKDFEKRGDYERKFFNMVQYVVGRTDWDRACVMQINRNLHYYNCGEILRPVFYEKMDKWSLESCQRHSVFMSQATSPVKGLHLALNVFSKLADRYNGLVVYIAGKNIAETNSAYSAYIKNEIKSYNLEDKIIFLGSIPSEEMYQYYLKANVYLSTSLIENSPNSVCEAMRVGTPVVSSFVGGVPSMISHGISGFLYPLDESYMMMHYIETIFDNDIIADRISENGRQQIAQFNEKDIIMKKICDIYGYIGKQDRLQ